MSSECLSGDTPNDKGTGIKMEPDFIGGLRYINGLPLEKLIDKDFIENELLISIGLNDELPHEQPLRFSQHYGKGFGWKVWQYPNQFSEYLLFLARNARHINSYIEIGCRHGGTFALTTCYLSRFNDKFTTAVAVDLNENPPLIRQMQKYLPVDFIQGNSQSKEFKEWVSARRFDLAFIDGDHTFQGVFNDFNIMKDKSRFMIFHDINSAACPGTTAFWNILKSFWSGDRYRIEEYCKQYSDVPAGGPFLGIGSVEIK